MARLHIGLTGGVASGKSAATRAFEALGIHVADADLIARELVEPGEPALREIERVFGDEILNGEGALDRRALRERIFRDADAKRQLEAILHPRIREALKVSCEAAERDYAIAAIPLLAEGGGKSAYPWLDRVLVIDVPVELQRERLMQRDGIDEALANRMIAAQASRADRLAIADDVVRNDQTLDDLARRITGLDELYRSLAGIKR